MSDCGRGDASIEPATVAAPPGLTRRALMNLGLEEMRQNGDSTKDVSPYVPVANYDLDDDSERIRQNLEAHQKYGIDTIGSKWRERNEKAEMEMLKQADERERLEKEARRAATTVIARNAEHKQLLENDPYYEGMNIIIRDPSSSSSSSGDIVARRARRRARRRALNPSSTVSGSIRPNGNIHEGPEQIRPSTEERSYRGGQYERDRDDSSDDRPQERSVCRLSAEYQLLEEEHRSAARFRPEMRPLFYTEDMNAFTYEADQSNKDQSSHERNRRWSNHPTTDSTVPSIFPPYLSVNGAVELASYLASASYIISLGGPPLPDLKYGIVIVPTGEESLLFSPDNQEIMSNSFKADVYAKSKAERRRQINEAMEKDLRDFEKAVVDYANGIPSEPDEEVRGFYQKRWQTRNGYRDLPAKSRDGESKHDGIGSLGTADNGHGNQAIEQNEQWSNHDRAESHDASEHSAHIEHPIADGEQELSAPEEIKKDETSLPKERPEIIESLEDRQVRPTSDDNLVTGVDSIDHEIDVEFKYERDSTLNGHGVDDHLPPATEPEPMNQDAARRVEGDVSEANGHISPAASVSATPNKPDFEKPISPEARYALELLLKQGRRRRSARRAINSLLHSKSHHPDETQERPQDPHPEIRKVFLEVSQALSLLANDKLRKNPGINPRVWDAAQKELARAGL